MHGNLKLWLTKVQTIQAALMSLTIDGSSIQYYPGGGGVLPYMGYIGMCRCEGYGFQAVNSRIGYINQSVWV